MSICGHTQHAPATRHSVALIGGRKSVGLATQLTTLEIPVIAVANTGSDRGTHRPDVSAFHAASLPVMAVTDDPNPTTVVVAGLGELAADAWVADGRPGRLLAVRLAGRAQARPDTVNAILRAGATVLGPDDADLVIDPVLKVLAVSKVRLPRPVIAVGHGHHRFEGTADVMVEVDADPAAQALAVRDALQTVMAFAEHD